MIAPDAKGQPGGSTDGPPGGVHTSPATRKVIRKPLFDLEPEAAKIRAGQVVMHPSQRAPSQGAPDTLKPAEGSAPAEKLPVVTKEQQSQVVAEPAPQQHEPEPPPVVPAVAREPEAMPGASVLPVVDPVVPGKSGARLGSWWTGAGLLGVSATVARVEGSAEQAQWRLVGAEGEQRWSVLRVGDRLEGNIELRTGVGVEVTVHAGDAGVWVGHLTRIGLASSGAGEDRGAVCVGLARGKVEVSGLSRDEFALSTRALWILSPDGKFAVRARTTASLDAFTGKTDVRKADAVRGPGAH